MTDLKHFIAEHNIDEVECVVPDLSGIARGKILPANKFLKAAKDGSLRVPEEVYLQTVTGAPPETSTVIDKGYSDIRLVPDPSTIRLIPWYKEPTAVVICDGEYLDGTPVDFAPRAVLRRVLEQFKQRNMRPVIAPELEFYLVKTNTDPDYPLEPPTGISGRQDSSHQAFGIEAVNEFDPVTEDIYDFCEKMRIDIDTLAHESGAAQMEINFNHGDPMELCDQVFLFKRAVRTAALQHQIYATFMAKPHQSEPGSAMHVHQSVVDLKSGKNIFAKASGKDSRAFMNYIGGLQRYIPASMPLFAPNVNSYRRLVPYSDAPINTQWGQDNRTCGLRVPVSESEGRRVENRVAGADANAFLALSATLACGLLGMTEKIMPSKPATGNAYRFAFNLPRHQSEALSKLNHSRPLKDIFGDSFVTALTEVKNHEYELYQQVISSWERENLLLNV